MKISFRNILSCPSNFFAIAFAVVSLGLYMRLDPRLHHWLFTRLPPVESDSAYLVIRITASVLMLTGSVLLFIAANRLRRSNQSGVLIRLITRK